MARAVSYAKEYENTPVPVVGIASTKSAGSAARAATSGVCFPNGVDLGGATYSLYQANPRGLYVFVIGPEGKVGGSLDSAKNAADPFGIQDIPPACRTAYTALKFGRFELARAIARQLKRARDEKIKGVAEKITAAADEREQQKLDLMEKLADEGRAGELDVEIKAFLLAFPTSTKRFKLRQFTSKANRTQKGRREALAAANFNRALVLLGKSNDRLRSQARTMCQAIATQFQGTYCAGICSALLANWPSGR